MKSCENDSSTVSKKVYPSTTYITQLEKTTFLTQPGFFKKQRLLVDVNLLRVSLCSMYADNSTEIKKYMFLIVSMEFFVDRIRLKLSVIHCWKIGYI